MGKTEKDGRWTYEQVTDGSLASSAFIAVSDKEFYRCKEVLALLGLPVPQYGAYYSQPNSDRFYLTDEGLVGTIVYRRRNPFMVAAERIGLVKSAESRVFRAAFEAVTDKVIQPLATIPLTKDAVLELNAGVARISRDGEKHVRAIRENLKNQGLLLINDHPEFIGTLPDPDEGTSLDVVCNRRAVIVENSSLVPGEAARQSRILGEQREEFANALQSGRQEHIRNVFRDCARIAALKPEDPRRTLVPYWAEGPNSTLRQQEIARAAQIYAHQRR